MKLPFAEIGEESEKGVVSALNDLFGPAFREMGEYLADKVRFHRTVALTKIVRRAKALSDQEGLVSTPPKLKFLVPFAEKASLEEDDALTELWANLLLSAMADEAAHLNYFQDVISKIGRREADLFEDIVLRPNVRRGSLADLGLGSRAITYESLRRELDYLNEHAPEEEVVLGLMCGLEQFGVRFIRAWSSTSSSQFISSFKTFWSLSDGERLSLGLLRQLGLLNLEEFILEFRGHRINIEVAYLAQIGVEFFYSTHSPQCRRQPQDRAQGNYGDEGAIPHSMRYEISILRSQLRSVRGDIQGPS